MFAAVRAKSFHCRAYLSSFGGSSADRRDRRASIFEVVSRSRSCRGLPRRAVAAGDENSVHSGIFLDEGYRYRQKRLGGPVRCSRPGRKRSRVAARHWKECQVGTSTGSTRRQPHTSSFGMHPHLPARPSRAAQSGTKGCRPGAAAAAVAITAPARHSTPARKFASYRFSSCHSCRCRCRRRCRRCQSQQATRCRRLKSRAAGVASRRQTLQCPLGRSLATVAQS